MKIQQGSLRRKILFINALSIIIILLVLIIYNRTASSVIMENANESYTGLLKLYTNDVDVAFKGADSYLVGLQSTDYVVSMYHPASKIQFYSCIVQLQSNMKTVMQSMTFIDELFLYIPSSVQCENGDTVSPQFIAAPHTSTGTVKAEQIRNTIYNYFTTQDTEKAPSGWFFVQSDNAHYLMRLFKNRDTWLGAIVSTDRLLSTIQERGDSTINYITYLDENGVEQASVFPEDIKSQIISPRHNYYISNIAGERFLAIAEPSSTGNYYLAALISQDRLLRGMDSLRNTIFMLGIASITLLVILAFQLHRWFLVPIQRICAVMNKIQDGSSTYKLNEHSSSEFTLVSNSFNNMIERIDNLTRDVYEGKILQQQTLMQYQNAELQYLKLQVNPHFYINCLNVINNLTVMQKYDLIREMTSYLGNHLRYTLEGNTTEKLSKEIEYVENYINIQQMRYSEGIASYIEIEPGLEDMLVPPLCIQTFVENTIKHQAVHGNDTDIFIIAARIENEQTAAGREKARIEIWDNGEGFSEDILEKLTKDEKIIDEKGEHYGIRNVIARMHIIYGDEAVITFTNHPETGGAQIVIDMPVIKETL